MSPESALKPALIDTLVSENNYNNEIHAKAVSLTNQPGNSQRRIAGMIGYSTATLSQYLNKTYKGDVSKIEKHIESILRREENVEFTLKAPDFQLISNSRRIWTVLQACDQDKDMGLIVGPAGCSKSTTTREYKRQIPNSILVVGDITTRAVGPVLGLLGRALNLGDRRSNSYFLQRITETLRGSNRLLMIDEAHFLNWEAFEVIRKLHDCAGIGIALCGQEFLYEQMRGGRRAFLWDQIYSRVGVRCHLTTFDKKDVKILADTICPDLDKQCLEYLCAKAMGKGRFRVMMKTLQRAVRIAEAEKVPVTLDILKAANSLLLL